MTGRTDVTDRKEGTTLTLHRDVDSESQCGGQVADGQELFGTDYWCIYCGAKFNRNATEEE